MRSLGLLLTFLEKLWNASDEMLGDIAVNVMQAVLGLWIAVVPGLLRGWLPIDISEALPEVIHCFFCSEIKGQPKDVPKFFCFCV